jgi:D-lactate dehydrogenase
MTRFAVFDSKTYDRQSLGPAAEAAGVNLRFYDHRLSENTVPLVRDVQGVCAFVNDQLNREVIAGLAEAGVGMIAMRCAGFNNVDLEAAAEYNIRVTRVPAYSPYAVAEHAVALLMALNRKVTRANARVRDMNFTLDGLVGWDMNGKTVGLIGTGKIGKIAGQIFKGFGMRVICWDPYPDHAWAEAAGCEYVKLDELGRESDVISIHVPLLPETHHIINALSIAEFKRGVYLVNVSRGALVDTKALIKALKSGHVAGVALDVYEEEEGKFFEDLSGQVMVDDKLARLMTFPNVIITAHQAFLTEDALTEIARVTVENMRRFKDGEEPLPDTALGPQGPM